MSLDDASSELLESSDVILQGKVTVLEGMDTRNPGSRIEVDAKLLSRTDGRIITAAQRSGPRGCLRQIVNRLGTALEQDFLRPFYGSLRVTLDAPENSGFHLTPVLREDALDEEKPPVELGSTVIQGKEQDRSQPWVTDPTSYTIHNILSGWYVLRIERPGFEEASIDDSRFLVREARGRSHAMFRSDNGSWISAESAPATWRRSLVHLHPRATAELDATSLGFELRKKLGALTLAALDERSKPLVGGRVLLRSISLPIDLEPKRPAISPSVSAGSEGRAEGAAGKDLTEAADRCPLLVDELPHYRTHSDHIVRSGDRFEADSFDGGTLAFEDYRGEVVPAGLYAVVVWSPHYRPLETLVHVGDGDGSGEPRYLRLERNTRTVTLRGKTESQVHFSGKTNGDSLNVSLNPHEISQRQTLPVDEYTVSADLTAFPDWHQDLDLLPTEETPPDLDTWLATSPDDLSWLEAKPKPIELPIKDRVWVGGRVDGFLKVPKAYYDLRIGAILDRVLTVSNTRRQLQRLEGEGNDLADLERRLQDIDLLILDEQDLNRIRVLPEVAAVIHRYLDSGHALMAFLTEEGRYESILGCRLKIPRRSGRSHKLTLFPGQVPTFRVDEHIELGTARAVPRVKPEKHLAAQWRVLGFAKKGKKPSLLESVDPTHGGYVMVWLDTIATHADLMGEAHGGGSWLARLFGGGRPGATHAASTVPDAPSIAELDYAQIEALQELGIISSPDSLKDPAVAQRVQTLLRLETETRPANLSNKQSRALKRARYRKQEANDRVLLVKAEVQNHALDWAEYLMYRRLHGSAEATERARARVMSRPSWSLSK